MEGTRLLSLDFFRGATVIAMITVNNPGTWNAVYDPLLHAPWNGCTPTDLIFPFFLFIVGVSIHFAFVRRLDEVFRTKNLRKITRRSMIIILLGILLAWFTLPLERLIEFDRLSTLRVPGVLQRIGVVYFICSTIYIFTGWLAQVRLLAFLLLLYYILMTLVPVPDFGPANLNPGTNLAAWTDRLFLEGHLWSQSKTWDPEGILSTIPAVGTCLLGMLTGQLMDKIKNPLERVTWLFLFGFLLILGGLAWDMAFPINKSLWTSSYVLYTGGWGLQTLAACHWFIDIRQYQSWIKPFLYFGMNAIFAFVASGIVAKILLRTHLENDNGEVESLWNYIYQGIYGSWLPPKIASLTFALTFVLIFYFILRWMYHRKLFIKA